MSTQEQWRFCHKCNELFYNGLAQKGHCPRGGAHEAMGFNFTLPYDVRADDHHQDNWRFCNKCFALFFDGVADKGACPADGGPHRAQGLLFVLPHDLPAGVDEQHDWRCCGNDGVLFFDGFPDKGLCDRGGPHAAAGYNFVLPYHTDVQLFNTGLITVPGGLPLSGSALLTVRRDGNWSLKTHAHDAGFDDIDYTMAAALVTPTGYAFTFTRHGHIGGTVSFGSRADDPPLLTGHQPQFADGGFDALYHSSFAGSMNGSNVHVDTIIDAATKAAADAIGKAVQAAVTAVLA